jgi:hypothetical protein
VVHVQVAFRHEFLDISVAEAEPQITTNAKDDHLGFEVSSLKECWPIPSHPPQRIRPLNRFRNTSIETIETRLVLAQNLRLEAAVAVTRRLYDYLPELALDRLARRTVARVAAVVFGPIVLGSADSSRL